MDHPGSSNCIIVKEREQIIFKERQPSNFGSEYDEQGIRLLRERSLPCRMRKVWATLALLQFLIAAALFITDIYAHNPISHVNPLLSSENTQLIYFRFDLFLGIISAIVQLVAAFIGLLPMGIPCRVYPPARYRSGHFLLSVASICLMIIGAVSYGIALAKISGTPDHIDKVALMTPVQREQETRNVIFTFKILLSLVIILVIGAIVNLAVVIAICTAGRKCHRNCKVCSAEN